MCHHYERLEELDVQEGLLAHAEEEEDEPLEESTDERDLIEAPT